MKFNLPGSSSCDCLCTPASPTGTGTGTFCPDCDCDVDCVEVTFNGTIGQGFSDCNCSVLNRKYILRRIDPCIWRGEFRLGIPPPACGGRSECIIFTLLFTTARLFGPGCDHLSRLSLGMIHCCPLGTRCLSSGLYQRGEAFVCKLGTGSGTDDTDPMTLPKNSVTGACAFPESVTVRSSFCFPTGTGTFGTGSPVKDCDNFVCIWEWQSDSFWQRIFYGCPAFFDQGGDPFTLCDCVADPPITGNEENGDQVWRACNVFDPGTGP